MKYTEYRIEYLVYGKWYTVTGSKPRSAKAALESMGKRRHEMELRHNYRPDIYPKPEAWRVMSREVTTTDWEEVDGE